MNFLKTNQLSKYILVIILLIFTFFIVIVLLIGDNRRFPVEDKYNEKTTFASYPIKTHNLIYDSKKNMIDVQVDFYIDEYTYQENNNKTKIELYYADPKEKIKIEEGDLNYKISLGKYKTSETKESNKLNIEVQMLLKKNFTKNLGLVLKFTEYNKVWDEAEQKSHLEESITQTIGFDYRKATLDEINPIKGEIINEDAQNYIDYKKLAENPKVVTEDGYDVAEENVETEMSEQEKLEIINNSIAVLEEHKKAVKEEIDKYQEANANPDYTDEMIENNQKIIEEKNKEITEINKDIEYYEGLYE